MGDDLVAACVFCASLLLGPDAPPLSGFSGEMTGAYGTLQRQLNGLGGRAVSDVTGKYPLIGLGWSKSAPAGLGAGTPASEFRVRAAWGVSHAESDEPAGVPGQILSTGTGRYENLAVALRVAVGPADSAEAFFVQHRHKITDIFDVGGPTQFGGQRNLVAERGDYAIGWRHRFASAEVSARLQLANLSAEINTGTGSLQARHGLPGGGVQAVLARGPWTFTAGLEGAAASVILHQSAPGVYDTSGSGPASLWSAGLRVARWSGRVHASLGVFYGREELPWVSLAMLGEELRQFNDAFRPASIARTAGLDATLRVRAAPGVLVKVYGRFAGTQDTVTLVDVLAARPSNALSVHAPLAQQFAFGLGAEFTLGEPAPRSPALR